MSSSVHVNNKGKDILILGEGTTQRLVDTTLTAEAKYSINFTQSGKRFVSSQENFTITNLKKKPGLKGVVKFFSVDFNPIDTNNILDICKYLMKKHDIK